MAGSCSNDAGAFLSRESKRVRGSADGLLWCADGKPGAAVRKYVQEVRLQEHMGNMRSGLSVQGDGLSSLLCCRSPAAVP